MRSDLLLVTEVSTWRGNLYIYVYLSLSLYTWVEILDMDICYPWMERSHTGIKWGFLDQIADW